MRRFLFMLCAATALAAGTAGCSSGNFYRGTVTGEGKATARAVQVKDGVEKPVTNVYSVEGHYSAVGQSIKPYLTLDGDWKASDAPAAAAAEADGSVVIRPLPPGAALPTRYVILDGKPGIVVTVANCDGMTCELPRPPQGAVPAAPSPVCQPAASPEPPCAPAAPAAAAVERNCGSPVYKGCDGTPGGNRPTPYGGLGDPIPPGSGCPASVPGVVAVPAGLLNHVGVCLINFVGCVFSPF